MRKILLLLVSLAVVLIAIAAVWIFQGSAISLYFDRFGTAELLSEPVHSIRYEGDGTGGILYANDVDLSLNTSVAPAEAPSVGSTKDGQLGLALRGKVFPLGALADSSSDATNVLSATPGSGDDAKVILSHSKMSWPTPFEVNFMTGQVPSWKRHTYQRLSWTKPNGSKLDMVWRYEQYFDRVNGWGSPTMTREAQTGLINVEITP
jgi:hypothetical protein